MVKVVKREKDVWRRVTELQELFFYTLYGFKAYWSVTIVGEKTKRRVLQKLGYFLEGYELQLTSNDLKHFLSSHFTERRSGQRGILFEDVAAIGRVVNSCTNVDYGNKENTIIFETQFPRGEIFQLVVTVDEKRKLLLGKSFRIKT